MSTKKKQLPAVLWVQTAGNVDPTHAFLSPNPRYLMLERTNMGHDETNKQTKIKITPTTFPKLTFPNFW
jgi:hypothetical protein